MITRLFAAIILFTSLLISGEKNPVARSGIDSVASTLYAEGNYWKLMEYAKQFSADTLSAKFNFFLGMSYAALSEPQRAQEFLRRSIALDSVKLQYRYQYARILSQTGLYNDAIDQLTQCIAIDSTYIPAHFQLGLTYAAQKKHPEKEVEIFSSLINRNPRDFLSLYYIAEAKKRLGESDSAYMYLRLSLSANPRYYPALIAVSNYLNNKKQYSEALPYYLLADTLRNDNKDLKFQIGECYRKLEDLPKAKTYFSRAIALDTANALYHAQLAYAYYSAGQFDSSVAEYQLAILNDSENPQYYTNLALVYKKLDMTDRVAQAYLNAVRVQHPDVIAYTYNDLAAFYMQKKLWRKTIAAYQRALDVNPDLIDPYYYMGVSHMNMDEIQSAILMFKKFLQKTENNPEKRGQMYSAEKMIEYLKNLKKKN
ncbi:MAG: tetratricopeptide repeat protein [Bacteroidota bacterium]